MQTDTDQTPDVPAPGTLDPPVDDRTYNVIQALTSSLEAVEAYGKYQQGDSSGLFARLRQDETRHVEQLLDELRGCLSASGPALMTSGPHRPVETSRNG